MKTVSKDEFLGMDHYDKVEYINNLCRENGVDPYLKIENGNVIDIDSGETIEQISFFDYALDLNIEGTALQGKVFTD